MTINHSSTKKPKSMTIEQIKEQVQSLVNEIQAVKHKHQPELDRIMYEIKKVEKDNLENVQKILEKEGLSHYIDWVKGTVRIDWYQWIHPTTPNE